MLQVPACRAGMSVSVVDCKKPITKVESAPLGWALLFINTCVGAAYLLE